MNVPVVMPQLGLTMTEGSVSAWLKKPGELVRKGEMLFVVSTDKADMEVESLDEGVLAKILVEPKKLVPVGTVIAYLERPGDVAAAEFPSVGAAALSQPNETPSTGKASAGVAEVPSAVSAPVDRKEEPPASPRARRLARELGIDLAQIKASGASGRIAEEDVRKYAEGARSQTAAVAAPDLRRRQLIAERMTKSIQTIPHLSVSAEVNAEKLLELQESLKKSIEKQAGVKLTVTDLLLKALGLALQETPEMQAVWEGGALRTVDAIDLGLAIATERGVVAPVVRKVESMGLVEVARRRLEASEKARQGRLSLAELEGGTGTLSNLGMYRVDHFQAIISPVQSFVLAVGRIAERPWVETGVVRVAPTIKLNLCVDHRVADGALAALFLGKIAEIIENPQRWFDGPSNPAGSVG
jgi:pyruvate dehydrogenase E2 component (dihydrolipoamide acetyltransferase)